MRTIEVENLSFRYPSAKGDTIREIDFSVERGEVFGFLGPSGAGKSTLQKILTGTLREYRGSVRVFGIEMKRRRSDYYQHIGVDFEFPNFYGKFTARENLRYFASLYAGETADPMALLERVGLHRDADKRVDSFSKGMKMRLGFVRALLHDPALLFLDEPTSGLDPATARVLKGMIREERERGKTVILTTHNMHDAQELCDRVAFIADGSVRALDTPCALRRGDGATEVEYRFRDGEGEGRGSCALAELGASPAFRAALQRGDLTSIHSKERTLEDVFIALTGKGLR